MFDVSSIMKGLFSRSTLRQKLTILILLVCSVVLLLSSLAYFGLEIRSFRRSIIASQTSLAEVVAANAAVVLPFKDRELARNILASLAAEPNIKLAYIFDRHNEPLAHYIRNIRNERSSGRSRGDDKQISPDEYKQLAKGIQAGEKAWFFSGSHLAVFCPVVIQGQKLGMVYINTDLGALAQWKRLFAGCMIAVMGLSFLLAYLLSCQLQHLISRPVLYLVDKMQEVAKEEDFSIRAVKQSNDELGALVDGFNEMQAHLQDRDKQLGNYRLHLEDLVGKRTNELRRINKELQQTVVELEQTRDAAEKANQAKSQFLANISHELRTPMVGVLSSTELLLNSGLDDGQRSLVATLSHSGEALLDILNDLLDLSKIEAGKLVLESVEFNLLEVINGPVELLGKGAFAKGVELICDVAPEIPLVLRGDPGRLRQILFNLLSNAIKFTSRGEVSMHVAPVNGVAGKNVTLHFSVVDSGIGIKLEDQKRIFDSFSQADDSTTRLHGGTGLGLAIVKQLIEMMGGQIELNSEPGKGSIFSFVLTFERISAVSVCVKEGEGKRILVVDSNLLTCRMLNQRLQYSGWTVDVSHECSDATKKLEEARRREECYDLMLMSDAYPLDERRSLLQQLNPTSLSEATRVVVMGPRQSSAVWDTPTREIVCAYLYKPLLPSRLHGLLGNVLQASENVQPLSGDMTEAVVVPSSPAEGTIPLAGRILLAEDNPTTGKLLEVSLSNIGYEVTVACDGQEAVEQVDRQAFDLVLMDCQMPSMDGYTAARTIRQAGHEIPIIALTAFSGQEDEERCLAAGMNDFAPKPFKHKVLHQIISKWLAESQIPSAKVLSK